MTSTESDIPKAVLYYSPTSVWSAIILLGLDEKGYGADELDLRVVDLGSGENYSPAFLRLNPKATVPTLVVPLQKTLSEDVESRYKAITDSKAIVEFLDKSRSAQSRTHTTSGAPAPSLTPATIAFTTTSNEIIDLLHSEAGDPSQLWYENARDQESLRKLSVEVLPFLTGKAKALAQFLEEAESEKIHVSVKTKNFWADKKAAVETLLDVFVLADKADSELNAEDRSKREGYFAESREAWETELKRLLGELDKAVIGPYALGDQISVADLHLAAWLARVAKLAGASASDNGETVVAKLEKHIGSELELSKVKYRGGNGEEEGKRTKLGGYWDIVRERGSWKKVYGSGLF